MEIVVSIPFIPLVIAALISFVDDKRAIPRISMFFSGLIAIISLIGTVYEFMFHKVIVGFYNTLVFDHLASILVPYVAIIGLVIRKYASNYMWDEKGYKRFFIILNFIFSSIYFMIMANNLIIMFIAWQILSLSLYFLISFRVESKDAVRFGSWAITVHRIGDFFFLLGMILTYKVYHTLNLQTLYQIWQTNIEHSTLVNAIALLFVASAMAKSAIIPFYFWLPYTSEAPTPVSALMHAGIVNAGGILLNKIAYLYLSSSIALNTAFFFGILTAIAASVVMLSKPDIKRSLGYSTVGQMGYMIMETGIGAFSVAIYHLIVHGIFKASLFLESGNVIHLARKDPNIPKNLSYKLFSEETEENRKTIGEIVAIFTIIPIVLFTLIEFFINKVQFQFQAGIIFLAFGWLTSAQLFLSFFKVSKNTSLKTILGLIVSFVFIVLTYEFMGTTFEEYLYGPKYVEFYKAANLSISYLLILLALLIGVIVFGWAIIYYQSYKDASGTRYEKLKWTFYKIFSRGFFLPDILIRYFKLL